MFNPPLSVHFVEIILFSSFRGDRLIQEVNYVKRKQSVDELRQHLVEQIDFLQSSAQSYDLGKQYEAKRMATIIRILLHETEFSKSLLGQLHFRKKMPFVDTSHPYQSNNLLTQQCLLSLRFDQSGLTFNPLFESNGYRITDVINWNKGIVLTDSKQQLYTRKDVILFLANQDGGAHVDGEISERYSRLKDSDLTSWKSMRDEGVENDPKNNAVYASMRQIAFEILQSLYLFKPQFFKLKYF